MYASVHTDRSGRVFVSSDRAAAGMGGVSASEIGAAIPLPAGSQLVPLEREAAALDRGGRMRPLGRGRLALAALLPPGHTRLLFPAYRDDPSSAPLAPLPYVAVAADPSGELVAAATATGRTDERSADAPSGIAAMRERPANALARQLARCARDHDCRAARMGLGRGDLPIPLGAPLAERPRAPIQLRSGYAGSPTEHAAFRPTAAEIGEVALDHIARGGTGIAFGRACDGEPLARISVLDAAIRAVRAYAPRARIHLETSGSDPVALRRALDAGLTSVTVRVGSALSDTYETLHGPTAHRWSDVRVCLQAAAEHGGAITIALLVLPGLTDRPAEIDATLELLGELPGGRLELRDLGADPLRALAVFPHARPLGIRALLGRVAEADHFALRTGEEMAAV